ncbi:putative monooxygenase [Wickerhamomyces ciferrii]|uniref:Monooxygenase n=1 Tax=Wickerhamomyces ciferrii (strain ATCC 14091 / BCRC 22168 / CBS 111 / JCM 3599 / NBRC 0793 / NRRL Y-1031 F-60-10) TaxID=1206466 RepID=K0KPQ2_WICCF|nr:putative monooxygenase [Wickerhamomyces ciferrii]CCH44142.1 putative monooxygenase [Wickerhamomyces ciferrii]
MTVDNPNAKADYKRKPLILSAATRANAGNWRNPNDHSRELSRDLSSLIEFAQIAEKGKFHNIFFVDHLKWFDVYGNSHEAPAKYGVNATRIDPAIAVPALAAHTKSIGFAITLSTVSEHPYHFARRLASLDHLTNGRVAWNIVASYIPSIGKNLLNGEPLPEHDERYVKTEEYLDVVYKLLLSSWRDDALVYDRENGIFANPDALREINHEGKYFKVKGPAITEPSPQRFPLIAQAGTSKKGVNFAAENAELVFIGFDSLYKIPEFKKIAKEVFNRDPDSIKFITHVTPFVGKTHEEAQRKFDIFAETEITEGGLVYFGGVSGQDLSHLDWDDPIEFANNTNGVRSTVDNVKRTLKTQTKKGLAEQWTIANKAQFLGSAEEVADQIEDLVTKYDVDGFNFGSAVVPESLNDIVELLVPELQKRGLAQTEYPVPGGTLRENYNGKEGSKFLPGDHPAYNLRWRSGISQEQFEKELKIYDTIRDQRRKAAEGRE